MSFILDALKKSETDRQQKVSAEFASVPSRGDGTRVPRWLWIFGLLLIVNLAVLLGLLLRPTAAPAPATVRLETPAPFAMQPEPLAPAQAAAAETPSFAAQVETAKRSIAPREQPPVAPAPETPRDSAVTPGTVYTETPRSASSWPTLRELQANDTLSLPELHLDIHVFSDVPADRFVFINMSKQHENSRLDEGPLVKEITPNGVVLEYRGTSFLLSRD